MSRILIIDDMKTIREQFAYDIQRKTGFEVLTAANGQEGLEMLHKNPVNLVILDLEMPVMDGLQTLEAMKKEGLDNIPVLVYTGKGNFQTCVRATRLGAYNFFAKDEISTEQLIHQIRITLEHRQLLDQDREMVKNNDRESGFIGESPVIQEMRRLIARVARVPSNVLITGESGTGKELIAREIHRMSPRSVQPFIAVNCAAIPENLVESELFGFEKGAFSGAMRTSKGKFELADGGTLMLDEIGDMPLAVQAKLLRVLQENEITRLGGEHKVIKINVRVIAATHRDLESEIEESRFRQDLFYRICTHIVRVPPLRERLEDIQPLTVHFVQQICQRFEMPVPAVHPSTIAALQQYHWRKNNVRELENVVERMIVQCDGEQLLPRHIPKEILAADVFSESPETGQANEKLSGALSIDLDPESGKSFQELKQDAERQIVQQHLEENEWHITNTAKALGIANHSNLIKIMKRLGIKKPKDE
ncbi:MAG: sigma-54-dependent Fis family transcriptional regulator [Calditrichaeota bacterium]|nr:sigma-54-dependent Fis family transcriptional regulator [Calditrichota bacterium]MCB9066721.1 sigma-54-dependent Fis family transcriptional regulator [Calditrichia bacterium]